MIMAWILGFLLIGCSDKTPAGDTSKPADDTSETGDSDSDTDTNCPDGPGVVEGILLGSDNLPLNTGVVRLYDSTGSEERVSDNVDPDTGGFRLVYGRGEYVVRGEYSTCVGEDIAVSICGEQTVYQNITLACAP